jgi:hypothetical protein
MDKRVKFEQKICYLINKKTKDNYCPFYFSGTYDNIFNIRNIISIAEDKADYITFKFDITKVVYKDLRQLVKFLVETIQRKKDGKYNGFIKQKAR